MLRNSILSLLRSQISRVERLLLQVGCLLLSGLQHFSILQDHHCQNRNLYLLDKIKFTDAIVTGDSVVIIGLVVFLFNFIFIELNSLFIFYTFLNFCCTFFHIEKPLKKSQRIFQFIFDSLNVFRCTFSSS